MPTILTLETKKYSIKIDNFEGPLDLLIYLIEKNKMDIYDINLTEITDQYIEYLNAMEEMNLEIASEFLIMASSLLYLKSKKLLPKQEDETEELTEEELIRRIIEYKKYKEITKVRRYHLTFLYPLSGFRLIFAQITIIRLSCNLANHQQCTDHQHDRNRHTDKWISHKSGDYIRYA